MKEIETIAVKKVLSKDLSTGKLQEVNPAKKRAMVNFYNLITGDRKDFNSIPIHALNILNSIALSELCNHTIIDLKDKGKATRGSLRRLGLTNSQARYKLTKMKKNKKVILVVLEGTI